MFDEFWMLYPRKVAKASARKAWKKLTEEQQLLAAKSISNHCQYWKAKETALDYIPHASTWLNQERWEDELVIEPKKEKIDKIDCTGNNKRLDVVTRFFDRNGVQYKLDGECIYRK